jgi:hypothetical protein
MVASIREGYEAAGPESSRRGAVFGSLVMVTDAAGTSLIWGTPKFLTVGDVMPVWLPGQWSL